MRLFKQICTEKTAMQALHGTLRASAALLHRQHEYRFH